MLSEIGPYRVLGELGRGANGVVYRAERPQLARQFALKTLRCARDATPDRVARFVREAQAAARLHDHPGIVGVHDVGAHDGVLWLAMDLVDGPSLQAVIDAGDCTPRRAAELCAGVARALGHAHRLGILHRDLKPANILVAPDGTARVTDFGLARDLAAPPDAARLTDSGMTVGTPAYMSPEQARGEVLDGRTDVYGLGATLYEALVGAPPFDGASAFERLRQGATDAIVPLRRRDAGIPVALETITLKCLGASPADRYATADEVADDLERWLRGEPILARPPGPWARARRFVRRHRVAAAAVAAALVVGGVAAGLLAPRWLSAERRADESRARALASLSEMAEAHLEAALALRRVDRVAEMQPHLDRVVEAAREVLAIAPDAAEPHFVVGRMQRALGRDEDAATLQERALASDPTHAAAIYERIVLRGLRWLDARNVARLRGALRMPEWRAVTASGATIPDRTIDEAARESAMSRHSDLQALAEHITTDCDRLAALGGHRDLLSRAQLECVRGLRAWIAGALDDASLALDLAAAEPAEPVEAHTFRTALLRARGQYVEALAASDAAIERDRGAALLRGARAFTRLALAEAARDRGEDPTEVLMAARGDVEAAVARGAHGATVWGVLSEVDMESGIWEELCGRDPVEAFARAIDALGHAIAQQPGEPVWPQRRALSRLYFALARRRAGAGDDATDAFRLALADAAAAQRLMPDDSALAITEARILRESTHGVAGAAADAERSRALAIVHRALEREPEQPLFQSEFARLQLSIAWTRARVGEDAAANYVSAEAAATRVLRHHPGDLEAWALRARARMSRALTPGLAHSQTVALLQAAEEDWSEAIKRSPGVPGALHGRAEVRRLLAVAVSSTELDAAESLLKAAANDVAAGAAGGRDIVPQLVLHARILRDWAGIRGLANRDPSAELGQAIEFAGRVLEQDSRHADACFVRGACARMLASWLANHGGAALSLRRSAVDDLERAVALRPSDAQSLRELGSAWLDLGGALRKDDGDPGDAYQHAERALSRAIELAPTNAVAWRERGRARFHRAERERRSGGQGHALYATALADLEEAARRRPAFEAELRPLIDRCRRHMDAGN